MKTCFRCRSLKPLAEFYPHPKMSDGHLNKCKTCARLDMRVHRILSDKVRERDRLRDKEPERAAFIRGNAAEWRRKYPERYRAQNAVNNAIRGGKLQKCPCEDCGVTERVHAHHDDYSRPLDVRWLCPRHHAIHHAN